MAATTVVPVLARGVHNAGPPAINALLEAARLTSAYRPTVARTTMQAAGYSAQALGLVGRQLSGLGFFDPSFNVQRPGIRQIGQPYRFYGSGLIVRFFSSHSFAF